MKAPESLHTKILDAARDEVQKEYGMTHAPFEKLQRTLQLTIYAEATKRAMEKQAGFLLWTFWMDWIYSDGRFMNSKSGDVLPELELYNIWREGK